VINYPKRQSEFEVQSHLYEILKSMGLNVRGEVKFEHCLFDLVIYDSENKPICIIEVKKRKEGYSIDRYKKTKQYAKYTQYGVPLIVCGNYNDIIPTIERITKLLE